MRMILGNDISATAMFVMNINDRKSRAHLVSFCINCSCNIIRHVLTRFASHHKFRHSTRYNWSYNGRKNNTFFILGSVKKRSYSGSGLIESGLIARVNLH